MGAGASVQSEGETIANQTGGVAVLALEGVRDNAADAAEGISAASEVGAVDAGRTVGTATAEVEISATGENAAREVEELLAQIEDAEVASQVGEMISKASEVMTVDELRDAVVIAKNAAVGGAASATIFLSIGCALNEAADMAPDVVDCVTGALIQIGPHLPIIGIAAGALGALAAAYVKAKEDDEVVKTFIIWCGGVKDWLVLVAGRVDKSGGENSLKLFEELKDKLMLLKETLDTQSKRGFVTKMLTSGSFNNNFTSCKTMVADLKTALKDYLDQEAQDKQEAMLGDIQASNLRVEEKVGEMGDDLKQIKEMLLAQQERANAQSDAEKAMDASEEEKLYSMMQNNVMVKPDEAITFKHLVSNVEILLYKGQKLPDEMKRGLMIAADEDNTGKVTKLQFINFYRTWQDSGKSVDEHLLSVADANPTVFTKVMEGASRAQLLMGANALKFSEAYNSKYKQMASDAAAGAAGAAFSAISGAAGMMKTPNFGFGGSSGATAEVVPAPTDTAAE